MDVMMTAQPIHCNDPSMLIRLFPLTPKKVLSYD